ncbi:MAG: hypothetical protein ABI301_07225 [Jatrophihabitantaceae bacterium]
MGPTPEPGGAEVPRPLDNGLAAARYVPLTDIDPGIGQHLLTALGRARIAAYLDESPGPAETRRLFVAAEERGDARTIVAAVVRAAGGSAPPIPADELKAPPDPLVGVDTDAAFADLIADWHVDTVAAIRNAEKALSREDEDWKARLEKGPAEPTWLDEQHYVPPVPPPIPRLSAPTIMAVLLLTVSILLLVLGGELGLPSKLTMLLGVCGVLLSAGILVMRLRENRDEDDDGAVL